MMLPKLLVVVLAILQEMKIEKQAVLWFHGITGLPVCMLRKWKMLQIGDRFGQGLACKVVGEGFGYAAALPESLRVRMRQHPR